MIKNKSSEKGPKIKRNPRISKEKKRGIKEENKEQSKFNSNKN